MPSILDFNNLTSEKAATLETATEVKKVNFGGTTVSQYFQDRMAQEQTGYQPAALPDDNAFHVDIEPLSEGYVESAARGGKEALQGLVGTAYGLGAGAGAIAETVAGEGGLTTEFKEAMVKKYVENEKDMSQYSRPEDSLTYSWNKAKEGDYGAMLSWASHGTGYVAAQLASILGITAATGGLSGLAAGPQTFSRGAAGQLVGSLVEREASRIATGTTEKVITDAIMKKATKNVASRIGTHMGAAVTGLGMEGGEIMGDLAKQSVERGTPLTGSEIGKGLTASALAGAVEYSETLLGLGALKGKLGGIPGVGLTENIGGFSGKAARSLVTGTKTAAAEAAQEATQTGIERWGKGQEVASEEGVREMIDAAGLGALGGGPTAVGGLVTQSVDEQKAADERQAEKQRVKPNLAPGFKKKVKQAAETEDGIKQYADPESPDFNETTAIHVAQERVKQEGLPKEDKIKTGNDALKMFQNMNKEYTEVVEQFQGMTDEEMQANPEKVETLEAQATELKTRISDTQPKVEAIVQAMQKGADPKELIKEFKQAFVREDGTVSGSPAESIRNVFGSSSSTAFFDSKSEDYVDLNKALNTYGSSIASEQKAEIEAGAKLQQSAQVVIDLTSKSSGEVNSDILKGSQDGDFKGIPQHLDGIASALASGNTKEAQNRQNRLAAWAKSRENRVNVFEGMYQAHMDNREAPVEIQQAFARINADRLAQGYKKPYFINDKTHKLVQVMHSEATALRDAADYGQQMIKTPPVKEAPAPEPVQKTEVEKQPRTKQAAPVQMPSHLSTKAHKILSSMGFYEDQLKEIKPAAANWYVSQKDKSIEELQAELEKVNPGTPKAGLYKELIDTRKQQVKVAKTPVGIAAVTEKEVKVKQEKPKEASVKMMITQADKKALKELGYSVGDVRKMRPADVQSIIENNIKKKSEVPVEQEVKREKEQPSVTVSPEVKPVEEISDDPDEVSEISSKHPEVTVLGLKRGEIAETDQDAVKALESFQKTFNKTTDYILNKINERFIDKDPLQYLVQENGKLPADVVEALGATAYKWLATQATSYVANNQDAMRKILHMGNDEFSLTPDAQKALRHIGVQANYLTESLGKEAAKLAGIKVGENAPYDLKERMELSFGTMIIAILQQQNVLKPVHVYAGNSGFDGEVPYGFDGLRAKQYDRTNPAFNEVTKRFIGPEPSVSNKEQMMTFYKIAAVPGTKENTLVAHPSIKRLSKTWVTIKQVWYQLYAGDQYSEDYSWTPYEFKEGVQFKTKRAGASLTKEQTANLIKNMNTPWVANAPVMNLFLSLGSKAQEKILGKKDRDTEHVSEIETNKGINLGIDRSLTKVQNWLEDAANQEQSYASEFYIPADFWKQERMGMASSITPQGDKLHRSLFNMKDWERTIDLDNSEQYKLFMLGVGMYLDIEFSKEGGLEQTVIKTEELLQTPAIQDGIKAIQRVIKKAKNIENVTPGALQITPEESDAIVTAVGAGKVNAQSLKSLVEYSRYLLAKKSGAKKFKTTMTIEIDGTANGPAFGRWQFMRYPEAPLTHLAALQTGGFRFHEDTSWDLSEHLADDLNHDAYQVTGFAWAKNLLEEETHWNQRKNDSSLTDKQQWYAEQVIKKMGAFQEIMGNPINSETGNVSKDMRKLAKPPTMKTMYSMGEKKLTQELIDNTEDTIYRQITDAALKNDQAALNKLNFVVNTLTGTWLFPIQKIDEKLVTKRVDQDTALNTELSKPALKQLSTHIERIQGKMMYATVKEVFNEIKETSGVLNKGMSLATLYYNTLREGYLEYATAKKAEEQGVSREEVILTTKDIKEVDKRVQSLRPKIQGANGSFLPVAEMDRARDYSNHHPVVQGYRKKDKLGRKIETPSRKKVFPHQIKTMADPGVSGTVLSIQHLDAAVANRLMAFYSFLNNHDGFTVSILDAANLAEKANEIFTDINSTYSIGESVDKLVKNSHKLFKQKAAQLQKAFPEFNVDSTLYENAIKTSIGQKYNKKLKQFSPMSPTEIAEATLELKNDVHETAVNNMKQRDILWQGLQGTSQYAFPGGEYKTGNTPGTDIYEINPSNITEQRHIELKADIESMQQQQRDLGHVKETTPTEAVNLMASSASNDMSMDPQDYELERDINKETLLDVYAELKDKGAKQDSTRHDAHLKNILENTIQPFIESLDLHFKENPNKATMGVFDRDNQRIFINSQSGLLNQGINMSTGEVYTHELIHAITSQALDQSNHLYTKVSRLYDVAFKEMQRQYPGEEYRVFLDNPQIDIKDPANLPEVKLAKERYDYFFRTPDKRGKVLKNQYTGIISDRTRSNHIDEFMAYALTNENFSNFLQGIALKDTGYAKSSWEGIRGKNIQETMLNIFQAIIDFFRGRLTSVNKRTALGEATALAGTLGLIQSRHKTEHFEKVRKFVSLSGRLTDAGNGLVKGAFKKILPKAETWKEGLDILMDDPSKGGELFREVYNKAVALDQGIIKTTLQEARGITDRLSDYYQLLTRRRRVLDSMKESMSQAYTSVAEGFFTPAKLTAQQKIIMAKAGLKTDISVLLDSMNIDQIARVFQDEDFRQAEIKKIFSALADEKKFPKTAKYAHYYNRAAMALGDFIVHSQFREGEDTGLNAQLIAELAGTTKQGKVKDADAKLAEPLVDQLASLHAVGSLSTEYRIGFSGVLSQDKEGVYKTLQLHKMLKEQAKKFLFGGASRLIIKGYTKNNLNPNITLKYGLLQDEVLMKRHGFTRSPHPLPKDPVDPFKRDIYVYTAQTGRLNSLASSILSFTRNKAKGTTTDAIADFTDDRAEQGFLNFLGIEKRKTKLRDNMFTKKRDPKARLTHGLIVKVDQAGNTRDYRYVMSEATKDSFLNQVNDFDDILGNMAGQIVDKMVTPIINDELVDRLKQTYDDEYQENPESFVQIGPGAKDADMVELYYMIPEKTRKTIKQVWGPSMTMYVPKDLMTLAFGYRKYSIVDAFTKIPTERSRIEQMVVGLTNHIVKDAAGDTGKGVRLINTAEQLATEITHYAKDNIIVKSLTVTLGNFGSNLVYLKMRGVPMTTTLKYGWEAIKYGTKYQSDILKYNRLALQKTLLQKENTTGAQRKLRVLEKDLMQAKDALNRNPVADSIDSGLMPSLVDDVDTQGQKTHFPGYLEKMVSEKTSKVPAPLRTAGKVLFLSQDTEAYKVLNNGVKLTDFVGRHILYNHYVKTQGISQKEAAQRAIEEFVNFDIPSHRITEYLNEIGLLWFTKYATRIPLIAAKAVVDKPVNSMLSYLVSTHTGLDNIIDSTIPNLEYKIDIPLTAWAGSSDEVITAQLIGSILP